MSLLSICNYLEHIMYSWRRHDNLWYQNKAVRIGTVEAVEAKFKEKLLMLVDS
jgi:hypothetical protein